MRIKNVGGQTRGFILVLKDQSVQRTLEVCRKNNNDIKEVLRKGKSPLGSHTPQGSFPFLRFLKSAKV